MGKQNDFTENDNDKRATDLFSLLKHLHTILRQEKLDKFQRLLPIGDVLVDRWEKARFYGFGKETSIYDSSIVIGDVTVGSHCWIGPNTILDGSGGLEIGDHCDISAGSQIYTHDTVDRVIFDKDVNHAPVKIGNNCYIGPNVIITKGVTIGDYVIVGANSLVNQNIPSNSKGWGTPFQVKGKAREDM